MPNVPKQRFLELHVGEISLVDSPANEHEYIVVKRLNQESGDMANENTEVIQTGDAEDTTVAKNNGSGDTPESVTVEVAKAQSEAVEKAMASVTQIVETITKSAASPPSASSGDSGDETDSDVEKAMKPADMYKAQLVKAGMKGEALTKAMDEFNKAFPPMFKPGASMKAPIKKSNDETASETADAGTDVQKNQEPDTDNDTNVQKALEALAVGVQKAKAFTPGRQKELQKAIETLSNLAKELGMKEIPAGSPPSTTVPGTAMFGETGLKPIMKALEDLKGVMEKQANEVTDVSKRLEAVEKTKQPSQSVEGEGDTDSQSVQKSFWSGVI